MKMSSISIDSSEKQLRELDAEIRFAMESLAAARSHQYQASVNKSNAKGQMVGTMDGRTRDRNKVRVEMFQKVWEESCIKTQAAEKRVRELNSQKTALKQELGII